MTVLNVNVGCAREFRRVCLNIRRRVPTLVVGKAGLGKTHLFYRVINWIKEESDLNLKIIYLSKKYPNRHFFAQMYLLLHPKGSEIADELKPSTTLQTYEQLILDTIRQYYPDGQIVIFMDDFHNLDKTSAEILNRVADYALLVSAARYKRNNWQTASHIQKYDTILLRPLDSGQSKELATWIWEMFKKRDVVQARVGRGMEPFLIKTVVMKTHGVPGSIYETMKNAINFQVIDQRSIRGLSIHEGGLEFMDNMHLIVAIFASTVILRWVYRSLYDIQISNLMAAFMGIFLVVRLLLVQRNSK